MNDRFRRSLVISSAAHAAVLVLVVLVPSVVSLLHRPKPKDILMVDLLNALPPLPEPEAPPIVEPPPRPPEPEKKKEISEKPRIKINTNRVRRATVQQQAAKKPPLTAEEIRKLLSAGIPAGGAASVGEADALSWYFALVRATMYEAWEPPSAVTSAGLSADVVIRVARDGTITQRTLKRGSGNPAMDASILRAVESVRRIKALPSEVQGPFLDITITFQPSGAALL